MPRPSSRALKTKPVEAIWHTTVRGEPHDAKVIIEYATTDRAWFVDTVKEHRTYGKWHSESRPAMGIKSNLTIDGKLEFLAASGANLTELADEEQPKSMSIMRCNVNVLKAVKARSKSEPWLHFGAIKTTLGKGYWALWVWDTRQVIEEGEASIEDLDKATDASLAYANDNKMQLKGNGRFAELFQMTLARAKRQYK